MLDDTESEYTGSEYASSRERNPQRDPAASGSRAEVSPGSSTVPASNGTTASASAAASAAASASAADSDHDPSSDRDPSPDHDPSRPVSDHHSDDGYEHTFERARARARSRTPQRESQAPPGPTHNYGYYRDPRESEGFGETTGRPRRSTSGDPWRTRGSADSVASDLNGSVNGGRGEGSHELMSACDLASRLANLADMLVMFFQVRGGGEEGGKGERREVRSQGGGGGRQRGEGWREGAEGGGRGARSRPVVEAERSTPADTADTNPSPTHTIQHVTINVATVPLAWSKYSAPLWSWLGGVDTSVSGVSRGGEGEGVLALP